MPTLLAQRILAARMRSRTVSDDLDIGLVVKYIGAQASGTVQVDASGNILFKHGALASEAADTTIQVGVTAGTITVSNAAGNTFGEILDVINASANWKAYLVDTLRTDNSDASTGSLLIMAATQAKTPGGIALLKDTSKVLNMSIAIRGLRYANDSFAKNDASVVVAGDPLEAGKWSEVLRIMSNNTFGSGTSLIQIYTVNRITGVATKVYERAGAATTVEQDLNVSDNYGRGVASDPEDYALVRIIGSVACTGFLTAAGKVI